jgi:hypothetical protein
MPLPLSLIIEVDGQRIEREIPFGSPVTFEGSGAPARLIVVAPASPWIKVQTFPGQFSIDAGCDPADGGYAWRLPIAPGKRKLYVNFPGNTPFVGFDIEYTVKPVATTRWHGTISDGPTDKAIRNAEALKLFGLRKWAGWLANSNLSNPNLPAQVNSIVKAGLGAAICLTPKERITTVSYPTGAIAALCKPVSQGGMSRDAIFGIGNEWNLANYFPGGDFEKGAELAQRISDEVRPHGFKTATPSATDIHNHVGLMRDRVLMMKRRGFTRFDYFDEHNYVVVDPRNQSAAAKTFREVAKATADNADYLGMLPECSEYGLYSPDWYEQEYKTVETLAAARMKLFAPIYPEIVAIARECYAVSAQFIMDDENADHVRFGLHLIETRGKTDAVATRLGTALAGSQA